MKKILVVDNEEMALDLVSTILSMGVYEIETASTASEAITAAKQHQPDLILMDLHLPDVDGLQATRLLKEDEATRNIKVVAFSAGALPETRREASEAGCVGFITKPVGARELLALVDKFLE